MCALKRTRPEGHHSGGLRQPEDIKEMQGTSEATLLHTYLVVALKGIGEKTVAPSAWRKHTGHQH